MKKAAVFSFIVAVIFILSACTLDSFEKYENFVMDMDINARIEEAFQKVNKGDTSDFFVSNVEALYKDLDSFDQQDNTAHEINMLYTDCVQLLLYSIDANKVNNPQSAKKIYDRAMNKYSEAQQLYYQFLMQSNRKVPK